MDVKKSKRTNDKVSGGKSNFVEKREKLNNPIVVKDRIGEIKNKDGSITIFYKSKENKILKEVIDDWKKNWWCYMNKKNTIFICYSGF